MEHPIKISKDISSRILTISTDYNNHKGGIGAVVEVYMKYFEAINFIKTHKNGSVLFKIYTFFISLFKLIWTLLFNRKIKIIHIHGSSYGSFYRKFIVFAVGKYIFRKKIIYHIHGGAFKLFYETTDRYSRGLIEHMLRKVDLVITLSESWNEYYKNNFDIRRITILPNIIDYPGNEANTAKSDVLIFLFMGLICNAKGIFDLVEVIAGKKERYRSRIKLLIGGNGEVKRLKDLIRNYSIEDIIEFMGWVTREEKEIVLKKTDVFILPSYREGLPVSILESMSYGKAIIATNVGGIPEVVRDRENGLLIVPGELKQLENSLDFFIQNPELIKEYGIVSERIVQKYLPHSVLKDLTCIYESLL